MTQHLATTSQQSGIRFSVVTLNAVARWKRELDAETYYPMAIPAGEAPALRQAAGELTAALAPAAPNEIEVALMQLRSSTAVRRESTDEAEATFRVIADDLRHVPIDILRKACREFAKVPGDRFFPKASGELFQFVNPILSRRQRAAQRFAVMADKAEADAKREAELNDPGQYTLDELRKLTPSMRLAALKRGWCDQASIDALDAEASARA